jgi:hypothetical protein
VKESAMKSQLLTAVALVVLSGGCATGSSGLSPTTRGTSSSPPNLDRDCSPDSCQPIVQEIADLEAEHERALAGPPAPTGPELADINRRFRDELNTKNRQLRTCRQGHPLRQPTPDVNLADLEPENGSLPEGTLTVSPVGPGLPANGVLRFDVPREEPSIGPLLNFTGGGCRVVVVALPGRAFQARGVATSFGFGTPLDEQHSGGTFHPVTGRLDLHARTTIEVWHDTVQAGSDQIDLVLTTHAPGGMDVDAAGNLVLVTPAPVALDPNGQIARATGVRFMSFTFKGRLSARPAP